MCSHCAPFAIVSEHSLPRFAKSAESMEGAMMAAGDMVKVEVVWGFFLEVWKK